MKWPHEELRKRILAMRECTQVQRCHTIQHHGTYSNGQHSIDAVMLLLAFNPDASKKLIMALLTHDFGERWVGDLPATVKRKSKHLNDAYVHMEEVAKSHYLDVTVCCEPCTLSEDEQKWLKSMDALEFWLWCHDQLWLGNQHPQQACDRVRKWLLDTDSGFWIKEVSDFVANFRWERTSDEIA